MSINLNEPSPDASILSPMTDEFTTHFVDDGPNQLLFSDDQPPLLLTSPTLDPFQQDFVPTTPIQDWHTNIQSPVLDQQQQLQQEYLAQRQQQQQQHQFQHIHTHQHPHHPHQHEQDLYQTVKQEANEEIEEGDNNNRSNQQFYQQQQSLQQQQEYLQQYLQSQQQQQGPNQQQALQQQYHPYLPLANAQHIGAYPPHQNFTAPNQYTPSVVPKSHGSKKSANSARPPVVRIAKKACIHCRKLKASCDNERPCGRCVKFHRECIDRTDEDTTMTTQQQNKRKHDSTQEVNEAPPLSGQFMVLPTGDHPAALQTFFSNSSLPQWSKSFLAILNEVGLRDTILKLHSQLKALPVDVPKLLEWHTQCSMCCSQFADQLTVADFHTFLTQGLTEEQLNSPIWLSSPLAIWSKLTTRPLFLVFDPLVPALAAPQHSSDSSSNASVGTSNSDSTPYHPSLASSEPEMRVEWLADANISYMRWQRLMSVKTQFETQLDIDRERRNRAAAAKATGVTTTVATTTTTTLPPPVNVTSPIPSMGDTVESASLPDHHSLTEMKDSEATGLESTFSLLDLSPSLAAAPPMQPGQEVVNQLHACWCPKSAMYAEPEDTKVLKTQGMNSVHGLSSGIEAIVTEILAPASPSTCICSLSTPLPAHVYVNAAFERAFGWRRIEVEKGFQLEGTAWMRHWYPKEDWHIEQMAQATHWKSQTTFIGEMAILAATKAAQGAVSPTASATATGSVTSSIHGVSRPSPWLPQDVRLRTRHGQVDSHLYRKSLRVEQSDGEKSPSAFIIRWTKLTR